jgi:hypothetical protein
MFVRLKIEDTREGKEEAKERAKGVARALGLKTYRVLDRTGSRVSPPIRSA